MKTAVIGAGITGLTCAHRLHQQGHEVLVLEKGPKAGGAIGTVRRDGYTVEHGPNSLMLDAKDLEEYFEELGLSDELVEGNPNARNRYILRDSKPVALPLSPLSLLTTGAFSLPGKLRILREFFLPKLKDPETLSVASFFQQRFGKEAATYLVDPFISGIYAGDPKKLSVQHAFPRLLKLEQEHGSVLQGLIRFKKDRAKDSKAVRRRLVNFRDGMERLPQAILEKLRPENLQTGIGFDEITPQGNGWKLSWSHPNGSCTDTFNRLIVTVPAHALHKLPYPTGLLDTLAPLGNIPHPPLACIALGYRRTQILHPLDGFGILVPAVEGKNLLGTIFASTLFPGRAPDGHVLLHCFLGGARNPAIGELNAKDIFELLGPELERALGIHGPPVFLDFKRWERSIPQCNLAHGNALQALDEAESRHTGLSFAGSYRNGVSVGQCIRAGWEAAQQVTADNS